MTRVSLHVHADVDISDLSDVLLRWQSACYRVPVLLSKFSRSAAEGPEQVQLLKLTSSACDLYTLSAVAVYASHSP